MNRSSQGISFRALMAVLVLLALPSAARADNQTIRSSDSAIWGAAGVSFYNYKEPSSPPDFSDSEHGSLPSAAAGVSLLTPQNLYFALEGTVLYGDANYNGAYYYYPTVPLKDRTRETILTGDGKFGRAFALGSDVMAIPYIDLGIRYWDRDGSEDYRNFDALGGLMLQYSPLDRLVLSTYGAVGATFGAQAYASPDTYDLGNSGIYKVGGKVGYDLTKKTEVFTTLDYDHFRYGESSVQSDDSYEPNSRTGETALRVGLSYHFR